MEILILWIVFSFIVAVFAKGRGRRPFDAFVFSLLLSPVIMFLYYIAAGESLRGKTKRITEEEKIRAEIRKELEG